MPCSDGAEASPASSAAGAHRCTGTGRASLCRSLSARSGPGPDAARSGSAHEGGERSSTTSSTLAGSNIEDR
ncbi:MAG: hypothetical protein QM674_14140 [Burkholderiaceae bacterium]